MEGGADTGFHHVEPEKYTPRLMHFCGKGVNVVVKEVFLITCVQGLTYNFQGGGTVQLSAPPVRSRLPFISCRVHVSIAGSQVINYRLNVHDFMLFFFQFCKIL